MSGRETSRATARTRVEWWVVTAWVSLAVVVLTGVAAAAGLHF